MLKSLLVLSVATLSLAACHKEPPNPNEVRIGAVLELTGSTPAIGASGKNAAEMAVKEINAEGGLQVGDKKMPLKLIIEDDAAKGDQAASSIQKLISEDDVIAVVGPNSSTGAIPASEVAEAAKILMIAPWSTDPQTTLNARNGTPKKYVYRGCFTVIFESKVLARFAYDTLKYRTAAMLYDVASQVSSSQADTFKQEFEAKGGKIVASETYTTNDKDFSAQLTKIKASNPDVLFLPTYYSDVPLITQQAKRLGMQAKFLGSDAWSSPELIALSNGSAEGAYFANHYSPDAKTPVTRDFVTQYQKLYGKAPDDIAALTYDAYHVLFNAITAAGKLDRQAVRDSMVKLPPYEGVTGTIQYAANSGDPVKSAVIMQVKGDKFVWVTNARS